jgi:phosphatidylinositol glycan class T
MFKPGMYSCVHAQEVAPDVVVSHCHKLKGKHRQAPSLVQLCLNEVPTNQPLQLSVKFTRMFLTLTEHPPDAHRGVDLPPAVLLSPKVRI